ncbi:hypothetical protein [Ramlibacter sp. 2FC]|uniref:hypothetical protein n=1 Tax=Ramlibacter sp. 2FC TaxID=2502188 RepID=UPI0010F9CEDE|nr:hypothetical protein [Ramlibacter sp. 2FC]
MPEQLSKYPELTLKVLRSAGARCAEGAPQAILGRCPADRFCQLPGGEICVYGLDQAAAMSQITPADWGRLLPTLAQPAPPASQGLSASPLLTGGAGLLLGVALGLVLARWRRRR